MAAARGLCDAGVLVARDGGRGMIRAVGARWAPSLHHLISSLLLLVVKLQQLLLLLLQLLLLEAGLRIFLSLNFIISQSRWNQRSLRLNCLDD